MRAAVELAERARRRGADRPVLDRRRARGRARSTASGGPIIALAHQPGVANQLTLEWGVYPTDDADRRDRRRDDRPRAVTARDFAGLASGARVVLTAGRAHRHPRCDEPGMVREIP